MIAHSLPRQTLVRTPALAALAVLAALTGCKKGVEAKNESAASVAEKVAKSGEIAFQPGHWESTMKLEKMDITGMDMPPAMKAQMQQQIGTEKTFASCLTPEEAKKPSSDFFKVAEGCTYKTFSMSGGQINAEMECKGEAGASRTMKLSGTYDSTTYDMHVEGAGKMPNGMQMNMAMAMKSKRTGDCTGKEAD